MTEPSEGCSEHCPRHGRPCESRHLSRPDIHNHRQPDGYDPTKVSPVRCVWATREGLGR